MSVRRIDARDSNTVVVLLAYRQLSADTRLYL
jgi:hypothetical protein